MYDGEQDRRDDSGMIMGYNMAHGSPTNSVVDLCPSPPDTLSGTVPEISYTTAYGPYADRNGVSGTGMNNAISDSPDYGPSRGAGVADRPYTVSMWIYYTGINNGLAAGAFCRYDGGDFQCAVSGFATTTTWGISAGGSFNVANRLRIAGNVGALLNTWNHFVMTYDGSGVVGGMKIYKNGKEATVYSDPKNTWTGYDNPVTADMDIMFEGVRGDHADHFQWVRELSATEVGCLFESQRRGRI